MPASPARALLLALFLLAFAPLAPAASARDVRDFPPDEAHLRVGPCTLDWTNQVDNAFTTIRCVHEDREIVHHRSGSGFAGPTCETRVLGETVHDCRHDPLALP